jgi:hypothetical protein
MLRVTGRLADVWIPSMGYAEPTDLPAMNATIDEATIAAGRAPEAVRRAYNIFGTFGRDAGFLKGSAHEWAEQLAELTLAAGVSTYVLGSDDARALATFAQEVAPAVRELVIAERGRTTNAPSQPPAIETVAPGASARHTFSVSATTDNGTRLATERAWDEGDRPSYAMVGREYSTHEQATAQHLVDVHDHLRQELTQVRGVVEQVRAGAMDVGAARSAINTMTMRQNNWTLGAYCQAYCRVVTGHHTLEDRSIFRAPAPRRARAHARDRPAGGGAPRHPRPARPPRRGAGHRGHRRRVHRRAGRSRRLPGPAHRRAAVASVV